MHLAPSDVDALVHNIPAVLRGARQFLPWRSDARGKKIPLRPNGTNANYKNPSDWLQVEQALELIATGPALGVGLALPEQSIDGYNLVTGLVAIDLDAKRRDGVEPLHVPEALLEIAGRF